MTDLVVGMEGRKLVRLQLLADWLESSSWHRKIRGRLTFRLHGGSVFLRAVENALDEVGDEFVGIAIRVEGVVVERGYFEGESRERWINNFAGSCWYGLWD